MLRRKKLVKRELRAMRARSFRAKKVLLAYVKESSRVERLFFRKPDELRLLILTCWAERYRVPLSYVIRRLCDFWKSKTRRPGKTSLLGVRITTLTSPKSELLLQEFIATDFPGDENISEWRLQSQRKLLGLAEPRGKMKRLFDLKEPEDFLYHYDRRIKQRKEMLDEAEEGRWRKRRRWRGNPWV